MSDDEFAFTIVGKDPYKHRAYYELVIGKPPVPVLPSMPKRFFRTDGRITQELGDRVVNSLGIELGDKIEIFSSDPERPGNYHAHPWAERALRGSLAMALWR